MHIKALQYKPMSILFRRLDMMVNSRDMTTWNGVQPGNGLKRVDLTIQCPGVHVGFWTKNFAKFFFAWNLAMFFSFWTDDGSKKSYESLQSFVNVIKGLVHGNPSLTLLISDRKQWRYCLPAHRHQI